MSQFQTISHTNIARGMDTRSALKNIQEGYAERIRNMDTNSAGFVEKRRGYQSYVGYLPLRVTDVQEDANGGFLFEFDSSINLFVNVQSSPVLGKGRLWNTALGTRSVTIVSGVMTGAVDTFSVGQRLKIKTTSGWADHEIAALPATLLDTSLSEATAVSYALLEEIELFWDSFTNNIYKAMVSGVAQGFTKTTADLDILVGAAVNIGVGAFDFVETDSTTIDTTSVGQTVVLPSGDSVLLSTYFVADGAEANSYTNESIAHNAGIPSVRYEDTIFITTGSAADITFNGTDTVEDAVAAWNTTNSPDVLEFYGQGDVVLSAGTIPMSETRFRIPQATHGLPNNNLIAQFWQNDTNAAGSSEAGTNKLLEPDEFLVGANGDILFSLQFVGTPEFTAVIYDVPVTRTQSNVGSVGIAGVEAPITFTMPALSEFVFAQAYLLTLFGQEQVKLESVSVDGKVLTFTVDVPEGVAYNDIKIVTLEGQAGAPSITVGADGVPDAAPEFCIYGISPEDISFGGRAGHVNALDEYSSIGQKSIVVGMGGNLFVESTNFALPSTRVDVRGFTSFSVGTQTVAPLFSSKAVRRIVNNGDNTATFFFSTSVDLSNSSLLSHYVAVSGASNSAYNGVFPIVAANDSENWITLAVAGSGEQFIAGEETDTGALLSLDTFILIMQPGHSFLPGDIINSSQFPEYNPVVREVSVNTLLIGGISGTRDIFTGVTLTGTRTSSVIKTPYSESAFVKGDVLTLSGFTRKFRVVDIDVTDQIHAVMTLDEPITVVDSTSDEVTTVSLDSRWECIEFPEFNRRTPRHFSEAYNAQIRLQTAKINDSIFYTSYTGSVMKYDGANLYQAGLIPWAPQTHTYVDISSAQERIVVDNYLVTGISDDTTAYLLQFDGNTMPPLPENRQIYIQGSGQVHSHKAVDILNYDAENHKISVASSDAVLDTAQFAWASQQGVYFTADDATATVPLTISSTYFDGANTVTAAIAAYNGDVAASEEVSFVGDGSLVFAAGNVVLDKTTLVSLPERVGYYFKLQAYDRNNNIVAGAVTDYLDCLVTLLKTGRVYHRLNNLPKFSPYHYDRVDLEIYRTRKAETVTPEFFRIKTIALDFQDYRPEKDLWISDSLGNATFESPNDLVSNAISLQTTGTAILARPVSHEPPQKSKYVTSIANRLVQGNVQGYDSLSLRLDTDSEDSLDGISVVIGGETYEFVDSSGGIATTNIAPAASGESIVFTVADSGLFTVGEWIQVFSTDTTNTVEKKAGPAMGWWKVSALPTGTTVTVEAKLAESLSIGAPNLDIELMPGGAVDTVPVVSFLSTEFRPFDGTRTGEITPPYVSSVIDLQRAVNTVQKSQTTPTFYAQSGSTFGTSTINLTRATATGTVSATVDISGWTSAEGEMSVYANNVRVPNGVQAAGIGRVFPSRILISPEKFPETFDNPNADSAVFSNAIVDVNSDDGEEITGFSPFLAISSSSDSQVQSTLIVLKSSSVYAIDVVTRTQTRLESSGQGCTIPGSIAATPEGVVFANKSGLYVVRKDLSVDYLGKPMEGYWRNEANKTVIEEEALGFTDSISRKYKLSVPARGASLNNDVVVYDYISEEGEGGSWTLYDGITASNWTLSGTDTLYGNYAARVFKSRNADNLTDYRDDDQPIVSVFEYSPRSFENSGEEVLLDSIVTHTESGDDVLVEESLDMSRTYTALDRMTNDESQKSQAVKNSPTSPSVLFYQVRYTHATKDRNFKLTGIDWRVAPTNAEKIPDAAK